jgi:hypothetical protein
MSVQSVGFRGAVASSIRDIQSDTHNGGGTPFIAFQQPIPAGRWAINYTGNFSFSAAATDFYIIMAVYTGGDVLVAETTYRNATEVPFPTDSTISYSLILNSESDYNDPAVGAYYVQVQAAAVLAGSANFSLENQVLKFVQV